MWREAVVFLGPSLTLEKAREILPEAEYRAPVRRGDLDRLLEGNPPPRLVGIVDGEFFQSLSVSPKEVVRMLERGVQVMGASSMGALRAVETEKFGTVGVGRIFGMFRGGEIDGDDEVAVTYCPESYRTVSEPLVNYRLALKDAREEGVLSGRESAALVKRMKSIHFPERRPRRFWLEAEEAIPGAVAALKSYFEKTKPDAKGTDAVALLEAMRSWLQGGKE